MYKRHAQNWTRHLDFILIDTLSLQLAYILSVFFRMGEWAYSSDLYKSMGYLFILIDLLVVVLINSLHNVVSRGYVVELIQTVKQCLCVFAIAAVYMFITKTGFDYSRTILLVTFLLHIVIGYTSRICWKGFIKKHHFEYVSKSRMLVVTTRENAEGIISKLLRENLGGYELIGVVLIKTQLNEENETNICGIPIVSYLDGAADYIVRRWIDSVYIDVPMTDDRILSFMDKCAQMGVPTHFHVPNMSRNGIKRFSEKIGGTTVLTSSINYVTPTQAVMKRCFDIFAGLIGSVIALIIMAIVGPMIKRESPGPILFVQERIGRNGKRFKMYKIRSMHIDAEERKQQLMDQNRVKDGMMFKLDFDPRIIGNEILPDGTKKTGIGEFIRRTSLDEFPQFFCVLRGVMSTVGTRPPTADEYERYQYHHRARMAIKPGITGIWQVSGRSDITDFEEVVRLDTEYIMNWSMGLDFKIMVKTINVLLTGRGAM